MADISTTVLEALNGVLRDVLGSDEKAVILGETVWEGGSTGQGVADSGVTSGLLDEFGSARIVETPVSENAIAEAALGLALSGYRPIVEIYSADFLMVIANEVVNDMAKWRAQHGSPEALPITIRGPMGATGGLGPEHSQCVERYFYSTPGLEVVVPGLPSSAAPLLRAAIRSPNPTLYLEHRRLYPMSANDDVEGNINDLGKCRLARGGDDVTVVAWGAMAVDALKAADTLSSSGVEVEVIELCSIAPMDMETILTSAERTGRAITVEEGTRFGGVGGEIVANIAESLGGNVSVTRLGMAHGIHSYDPAVESELLPGPDDIVKAVWDAIA